ncbi:MAG: (2Fe-2S) ferredoxin domain-containing protein [Elusimicrobia bacterium]|nr:(2Fe-2S) ferredoxin domain-containing protein [Elusimicrobiota bacterium]
MDRKAVPFRKTVFVCTNIRADGRPACANPGRGGDEICRLLKEEIKKAGLKDQIRVARSGCLDLCAQGPNLFLYPDGQWWSGVKPSDMPEIARRLS